MNDNTLDIVKEMPDKRARGRKEMVAALERHLRLLREYSAKAFVEGNADFGGEVAGKLRLLVTRFGSNRPLLLDLMADTGIESLITLGGPPVEPPPGEPGPGDEITLARYLKLTAIGIRVSPEQFVTLNKVEFIRGWAEQTGSSHEDWTLDPALEAIFSAGIFIGGLPAALVELRVITQTVLHVADRFLSEYRAKEPGDA